MKAADKAYYTIKSGILGGRHPPGSRITEQEIVEIAGVSRTPVREALLKLESEGLVVGQAHHGVVVSQLTNEEALEVFELRAMLEGYCARLAAGKITEERLGEMRALVKEQEAETKKAKPNRDSLGQLNAKFHAHIYVASGQARLQSILTSLWQPLAMRWTFQHYGASSLARSVSDHAKLIEYLEARDGEAAESLMRAHVHAAAHEFKAKRCTP